MAHKGHSDGTRRTAPSCFSLTAWIHGNFDQSPKAEKLSWACYAILGINLGMVPVLAVLIANQLQV